MQIAILGNNPNSYVNPMAEGLHRMLSRIGVDSTVFGDGIERLGRLPDRFSRYIRANGVGTPRIVRRMVEYALRDAPLAWQFIQRLKAFDAIVIVRSVPGAFLNSLFCDRTLRSMLPQTPIILYDVFYLPTRGPWGRWLKEGKPERGILHGGNWGLERYDWYLCASVVSEIPLPRGPQPVSLIGLDLDDGTLRPEPKREFVALLDFEHPPDMLERAIQIEACEESGTKYAVLNGRYPMDHIRRIYRQASVYFVAMRESFGLPICELQMCGSYVFTPYAHWCPSHSLKADVYEEGLGQLPPNFVVYDNDKMQLMRELQRVKATYDANAVVASFRRHHPQFFRGNEQELAVFVDKLRTGTITSESHQDYAGIVGDGDSSPFDVPAGLCRHA